MGRIFFYSANTRKIVGGEYAEFFLHDGQYTMPFGRGVVFLLEESAARLIAGCI